MNHRSSVGQDLFRQWRRDLLWILPLALLPWLWLKAGEFAVGGDSTFPLDPVAWWTEARRFVWEVRTNGGEPRGIHAPTLYFHGLQALLSLLGLDIYTLQKVFFGFWFVAMGAAMNWLMLVLQGVQGWSRGQRVVAVTFFLFNPFVFNMWEAVKGSTLSISVCAPLLMGLLIAGWQGYLSTRQTIAWMGLAGIFLAEIGADPPMLVTLLLFLAWMSFVEYRRISRERPERRGTFFGVLIGSVAMLVVLSAVWLAPYGAEVLDVVRRSGAGLGAFGAVNWLKGISTYTSFFNVSRLQGYWDWYYTFSNTPYVPYAANYFSHPWLVALSIACPLLAYGALLLRPEHFTRFFAGTALLATLLACGAHLPTGWLYLWMTDHVPGFAMFRSPYYRFGFLLSLSYAYLISSAWRSISERMRGLIIRKTVLIPVLTSLFLFITTIVTYAYPAVTGAVITRHERLFSMRQRIPPHVFTAIQWFKGHPPMGRMLLLPQDRFDMYRWGYGSTVPILALGVPNLPLFYGEETAATRSGQIRDLFYTALYERWSRRLDRMADALHMDQLLLRGDSWYDYLGETDSPEQVASWLETQERLETGQAFGPWQMYRFITPLSPKVSLLNEAGLLSGDQQGLAPLLTHPATLRLWLRTEDQRDPLGFLHQALADPKVGFGLYQRQWLDLALDALGASQKRLLAKGQIIPFSAGAEGVYECWVEQDSRSLNFKVSGLVDSKEWIGAAPDQAIRGWPSAQWRRVGPVYLTAGSHTWQFFGDLMETPRRVVLVSSRELLQLLEKIEKSLSDPDKSLTMAFSTEQLPKNISDSESRWNIQVNGLSPFWPDGVLEEEPESWQWLQYLRPDNVVLTNPHPQAVAVNLGFEAYSPYRQRQVCLDLNGVRVACQTVRASAVIAVVFSRLTLKPGRNELMLMVPELAIGLTGKPEPRAVTCAFRNFKVGPATTELALHLPREGTYWLDLAGYPVDSPEEQPLVSLDGQPLKNAISADPAAEESQWRSFGPMTLAAGRHQLLLTSRARYHFVMIRSHAHPRNPSRGEARILAQDPTRLKLEISAPQGQDFLVFKESWHSKWTARRKEGRRWKKLLDPLCGNGYCNVWRLEAAANNTPVVLEYSLQRALTLGAGITLAALIACLILLRGFRR